MKKRKANSSKVKPKRKDSAHKSPISLKSIWPQERDFMARPDRYKYVRQLVRPRGCVFCTALAQGPSPESLLLWEGKAAMVVLNKYPYNNGHLLVLPRRHCGDLLELSDDEYFEVQRQLRRAVGAVIKCYNCPGCNIGLNHGAVAGAGLPDHLHWHIVPRWAGDTNFFPVVAETKVLAETLEQTYARLRPYFDQES